MRRIGLLDRFTGKLIGNCLAAYNHLIRGRDFYHTDAGEPGYYGDFTGCGNSVELPAHPAFHTACRNQPVAKESKEMRPCALSNHEPHPELQYELDKYAVSKRVDLIENPRAVIRFAESC